MLAYIFLIHYMEISTLTFSLKFYFRLIHIIYIEIIRRDRNRVFISADIFTWEEVLGL